MANASELLRGHTDTILLAQLNKADSYGYQLSRSIAAASGGELELKEATLYSAFRRLETAGAITSYWGDESAGARRRYYSITELGKEMLREGIKQWHDLRNMLNDLLEEV